MCATVNETGKDLPSRIADLRSALNWLRAERDLVETDKEVDPDLQITAIQKRLDGSCPILFHNVRGRPNHSVVTNVFADIDVVNKLFGWKNHTERKHKLAHALSHPLKPLELTHKEAPVQQVVHEKPAEVNDYLVPIRHTDLESSFTAGSGIRVLSGECFGGGADLGYNRMNFRWGNVSTIGSSPGSHLWQVISNYYASGKTFPITYNYGVPPACTLLAGAAFDYVILPYGCDEIAVAGAVQGSPVRLVKARTVDAMALADAEIVLEGYIDPRDQRYETAEAEQAGIQGRYHFHPEWAGYMGKSYKVATFHVTAVTTRAPTRKLLVHVLGAHSADDKTIDTSIREAAVFELCNRMQPGIVQDVHIPYPMTDWGGCIIQVHKRNRIDEGWQRNFLSAILSTSQGMRLAIAVSEDVDIYDMDEIIWCLTTRVNPQTDILNPLPGGRGQVMMPAERLTAGQKQWTASNTAFEGGMGIDATVPFGYESDFMRPVYAVDRVRLEEFFSAGDLENAQARMKGWVLSLARTGR